MKDIASLRTEYKQHTLNEYEVPSDPLLFFQQWFKEALEAGCPDSNAMCLATAEPGGQPSTRIVLLKAIEHKGFVFYTNYHSRKGRILEVNNKVSLNFFWPELERQVRVEGIAQKVSSSESDEYFASRPRGSQLGAWASDQSTVILNREELEKRLETTGRNFENQVVLRPAHWGGYLVEPAMIEFWQGRPNRLHDRIQYTAEGKIWRIERLAP